MIYKNNFLQLIYKTIRVLFYVVLCSCTKGEIGKVRAVSGHSSNSDDNNDEIQGSFNPLSRMSTHNKPKAANSTENQSDDQKNKIQGSFNPLSRQDSLPDHSSHSDSTEKTTGRGSSLSGHSSDSDNTENQSDDNNDIIQGSFNPLSRMSIHIKPKAADSTENQSDDNNDIIQGSFNPFSRMSIHIKPKAADSTENQSDDNNDTLNKSNKKSCLTKFLCCRIS